MSSLMSGAMAWAFSSFGRLLRLAEGKVEELTLSVAAHNQPAVSLYRRMCFADYGLDRHALRVNNKYVDEILMKLPLKVDVPSRLSVTA